MLWYKCWLETRWRFLIGLAILICSAASTVYMQPTVVKMLPTVSTMDLHGELGRRIKEAAELARDYRGYIWSHWFRENLMQIGTLFAVLLGTGGLLSRSNGGGILFTLSMPVSRNRWLAIRAATGLAEFLVLVVVSSLVIPILSPAIGESYSGGDLLIQSVCLFIAGSAFFSFSILLSTIFSDMWPPLLIAISVALALGVCEEALRGLSSFGIFHVMTAEIYFRTGQLPWIGLLTSITASGAMLYGAAVNMRRRDF